MHAYVVTVERRLLFGRQDLTKEAIDEEIEVTMVTDLQEKQTAESRAIQSLLDKQVSGGKNVKENTINIDKLQILSEFGANLPLYLSFDFCKDCHCKDCTRTIYVILTVCQMYRYDLGGYSLHELPTIHTTSCTLILS